MNYINIKKLKENLFSSKALDLLVSDIPDISNSQARFFDFTGKNTLDLKEEYVCRIIAARGFEKLKQYMGAVFCYDRAAKNADFLGFPMAGIRCRIRSCKLLYYDLGRRKGDEDLEFASNHILKLYNQYNFNELEKGVIAFNEESLEIKQLLFTKEKRKKLFEIKKQLSQTKFSKKALEIKKELKKIYNGKEPSDQELDKIFNGNR